MFDLKAKLLEKGLVTKEQVEKIANEKTQKRREPTGLSPDRVRALRELKEQQKSEQYITIRKWVDFNRLDKVADISLDCEKFFINVKDAQVTWLTLKKEVIEEIKHGRAGVIAYMSNHGLAHAVVPRDIAEDVREVFPDWIKTLNDKT